jgi:NAD(P)-dependent dehydrogenase (short-subunit alcohol dehydrogenase family)
MCVYSDLASFASVRLFAKELLEKDIHVDILILNAGMQTGDELTLSEDGVEMLYQVNHLSQFLLTRLLLPTLSHTSDRIARIVHVSSSMHYIGQIDRDAYNSSALNSIDSTRRTSFQSYSDSKLMNAVFSNSLDRFFRQEGNEQYSGISSVSIHPGFVVSDLDRGLPSHMEVILRTIRSLVARPTIDGAVTQVTAATHPQLLAHGGGLYFEDQCIMSHCTSCLLCSIDKKRGVGVIPHGSATSFEDQDWLWDTSSAIVGLSNF